MIRAVTLLFLSLLFFEPRAYAADMTIEVVSDGIVVISLNGPIEEGDAQKFMLIASEADNAIVNLNSPGGLVNDGLLIAEQIYSRNFDTYVSSAAQCVSMCGIIWLAGARRYLDNEGRIGFHGAYVESDQGMYSVSGPGNAKIGAFLGKLDISHSAISFITNSQPNEFSYVDFQAANLLGFSPQSIYLNSAGAETKPIDPVSFVKIAAHIALYQNSCVSMFRSAPGNLENYFNFFSSVANEVLGGSVANYEFNRTLINISKIIEEQGQVISCIEAERVMRMADVPTGVYGPSFSCAEYTSDAHQALCRTPSLWASDIIMNSMYWNVRENSSLVDDAPSFFERQQQWVFMRDGCSSDIRCLEDIYAFRLREISRQYFLP
jgi:hypothetical protein